jgi:Regulator of G protein signaling domain
MGEGMSRIMLCSPKGLRKVHHHSEANLQVLPGTPSSGKVKVMVINPSSPPPIFNIGSSPNSAPHCRVSRMASSSFGETLLMLNDDAQSTAEFILGDDIARGFFFQYLLSEHAEENIKFYDDAQKYIDNDSKLYLDGARVLVIEFMCEGCDYEINVSDSYKRNFVAMVESAASKEELVVMLKLMQKEMITILAGAIPRYKSSDTYTDWVEHESATALQRGADKKRHNQQMEIIVEGEDEEEPEDEDMPDEVLIIKNCIPIIGIISR